MGEIPSREKEESESYVPPCIEKDEGRCYIIYAGTKEDVDKIVKTFWSELGDRQVLESIDSGMLHTDKEITSGPRTSVFENPSTKVIKTGYKYFIVINQNGPKLDPKTEEAILSMWQKLGF